MKKVCSLIVTAAVAAAGSAGVAHALPPFKKAFEEKYVEPSDNDVFKDTFKKASCNACHVKGEPKDVNNVYGEALAALIVGSAKDRLAESRDNGTKDAVEAQVLKELQEAFGKAESAKADGAAESFGDLIKAGKLPGGDVE